MCCEFTGFYDIFSLDLPEESSRNTVCLSLVLSVITLRFPILKGGRKRVLRCVEKAVAGILVTLGLSTAGCGRRALGPIVDQGEGENQTITHWVTPSDSVLQVQHEGKKH